MQAVVIQEHGGPEVLALAERPDPVAGPGDVVVELRAAALNRRDTLVRAGAGPAYRFPLPLIPGSDGAGVRIAVTSASGEKLARARELGAAVGVSYCEADWPAQIVDAFGPADVVVDSAGGTWQQSLETLGAGGRLVSLGATTATEATVD